MCYLNKKSNKEFWLKRIIGLPGDTVMIRANKVYINSQALKYESLLVEKNHKLSKIEMGDIISMESGLIKSVNDSSFLVSEGFSFVNRWLKLRTSASNAWAADTQ